MRAILWENTILNSNVLKAMIRGKKMRKPLRRLKIQDELDEI